MTAQGSLGDVLFGAGAQDDQRATAPLVARYVSEEGESFVLDRSSPTPLIRFEDSDEVFALVPSPAARGDTIYLDDLNEPVLRATKLGGLTLFAHARAGGAPVAVEGLAPSLRLQALSPAALALRLGKAIIKATRAAKRLIVFEAELQEVNAEAAAVFADAAAVAAEAIVRITHRKDSKVLLSRVSRVMLTPGPTSSAGVSRGTLNITVNANSGLAGRPSSARIIEAAVHGR